MKNLRFLPLIALVSAPLFADSTQTYKIDPVHSGVNFKIRHFFNNVPGQFKDFSGTVAFNQVDLSQSKASAVIKVGSIHTANTKRDEHLTSPDYFDAEKYQTIEFTSNSWEHDGTNADGRPQYKVAGDLTMLGQTHPVTLTAVYLGEMEGQGPYSGLMVAGWEATGTLDRTQWGINAGKPIVGEDVEIELSIQGHRSLADTQKTGGAGGK